MAPRTWVSASLGFCKWALVLAAMPCIVRACQGIFGGVAAADSQVSSSAADLPGSAAMHGGLFHLLLAAALLTAAWGISFLTQQNSD